MSTDPQTDAPAVLLERSGHHVAVVTLNRPHARNAVNGEVATLLERTLQETEADDEIRVVVLTGTGSEAFCAGADLKEVAAGRGRTLRTEAGGFAGFVQAPRGKPWIAAVNGAALAGGTEIALACDLVVAAENATFGLPEVQRGLIAAAGGLYRLPRAIPRHLAIELALTGDALDAARAQQWGLVNRKVPAPLVRQTALDLAERIARNAPLAVRESLRIVRRAHDAPEAELQAMCSEGLARVAASADLQEGLRAFVEKRAPKWTGR